MPFPRSSGILLHPTSFPGRFGIGDLGQEAYRFLDFLADHGQTLWQVMPLGPTGYGDSPYATFSAFAGNPLLIALEPLIEAGYLTPEEAASAPPFPDGQVDYGAVIPFKLSLLKRAFHRFRDQAPPEERAAFHRFCQEEADWLDDFALFMALKEHHGGAIWSRWEPAVAARRPDALAHWSRRLEQEVLAHRYFQFLFFRQWGALKQYANTQGIRVIGDIPIFVAYDSADVWVHRALFHLDEAGNPTVVAGVPPDYFSPTGQLWGNPLYRWEVMAETGYAWWIARLRMLLRLVDIVRLDHFRGFEAYWEVPAGEETAVHGRWVPGPGAAFFEAVREALGDLPIIAEDLGFITPQVEALRERFGFPGMKVLQFAFDGDPTNPFLPHNYPRNCVVYTGTHDNDTTVGWFQKAPAEERAFALKYLGTDGREIHWDLIRLALASVADLAVIPLQDLLGLGSEARMNYPSRAGGNWRWRYRAGDLTAALGQRLAEMTEVYGRWPQDSQADAVITHKSTLGAKPPG